MTTKRFSFLAFLLGSSVCCVLTSFSASDALTPIPQTNWTLHFVDSEELSDQSTNGCCDPTPATNAFDGNPNTFWHTEWVTSQPGFPHEIQIDLGATYSVAGFRHLPRQDGQPNGRINQYEFYVSTDGSNWGSPAAAGNFPDTTSETEVLFPAAKAARYVRLIAYSSYSADGFVTSLAELNVLTDGSAIDSTPPTISHLRASPSVLWPPNHQLVPVTVTVDASDDSGLMPSCKIIGVSVNEKSGPGNFILTGDLSLKLRAERSGRAKPGRVYTIVVQCTDPAGNSSQGSVNVTVPHDKGKGFGK